MATAPVMLSLEEYLRTDYTPDADYVHGELQERNVGKFEHGKIQGWLFQLFNVHAEDWNVEVSVEQRILVAENEVRVADVAVMLVDSPYEEVITFPPLVCIEILSPDDRLSRAKLVLSDYVEMGVANVWLIDPLRQACWTFDRKGLHEADPTALEVIGSAIRIDLSEAFATLDKSRARRQA